MSAHTGPWTAHKVAPRSKLIQPEAEHYVTAPHDWPGNRVIAAVHHVDGVSAEDTARLIASAPDLLAALRALLDQVDVLIYRSEDDGVWDEAFVAIRESARAAIAKAEGVRP